jgi:hypothetical protein
MVGGRKGCDVIALRELEKSVGSKRAANTYQLRVTLDQATPAIWRRLHVPSDANFGWLHAVLQVAMGWTNSHLHQFRQGNQAVSDPAFELEAFCGDPAVLDEREVTVSELISKPGRVLRYEYDFGDSWSHVIKLEKILDAVPALARKALCVGGAGACPPEDCGGVWGYAELQKALKDPQHAEHQTMKEWLGRPLIPEQFSCDDINPWLSKLRWPKVTEAALRNILMDRDGA